MAARHWSYVWTRNNFVGNSHSPTLEHQYMLQTRLSDTDGSIGIALIDIYDGNQFCGWVTLLPGPRPRQVDWSATPGMMVRVVVKSSFSWPQGGGLCFRGRIRAIDDEEYDVESATMLAKQVNDGWEKRRKREGGASDGSGALNL